MTIKTWGRRSLHKFAKIVRPLWTSLPRFLRILKLELPCHLAMPLACTQSWETAQVVQRHLHPVACFSAIHSSQEVESMMVSNGWKVDTEDLLCEFIIQIHKLACVCAVGVSTTENNFILPFETMQLNLKTILLTERSQPQKQKISYDFTMWDCKNHVRLKIEQLSKIWRISLNRSEILMQIKKLIFSSV